VNQHTQIYDYDDIPTNHGDEDLTSLYDAYEIDLLRQNVMNNDRAADESDKKSR
jgi:hypothetical protein